MNVLILYGLPCSGKSSVLKSMSEYHAIAVDTIIKSLIPDPSVSDFSRFSTEIIETIVSKIKTGYFNKYIIEMGCLMPKTSIDLLERYLNELSVSYLNIKLVADDSELIKRIIKRNKNIDLGKSTAIKVDGPDYLTRFKLFFEQNQTDKQIEIDTTEKSIKSINLEIMNALSKKSEVTQ
ncbi:MAG: AAA family ATPase [Gammaproteobacteria bacterium]|nr:AAA family ATPase [Gammaproteobacteria bacterium]